MRMIPIACCLWITVLGCAPAKAVSQKSGFALEQVRSQIRLSGPQPLTAGVAKVEITPAVGTPLAGYSKRKGRPSIGIRDPLYVRVLAIGDGEDRVVLVSTDLLIFPDTIAQEILERISADFQIPPQAILLAATHTHSGAGSIAKGFLYEKVFGPYREEQVEGLKGRVLWAVRQALENQKPVRWSVQVQEGSLAGLLENRMNRSDPVDSTVTVALFESLDGKPLAIVVNLAAHPTLVDWDRMQFSADYPGEVTRLLEQIYPGAMGLFLNGAAGDVRPKDALGEDPTQRIDRFARAVAEVATGMIQRMDLQPKGDLAAWGAPAIFPLMRLRLGWIPIHPVWAGAIRFRQEIQNLLALDRFVWVSLPAEMTAELGLDLKKRLQAMNLTPILVGYSNGYWGYAVTPAQYRNGSYEAWMTWYGADFGLSLIRQIQQLARVYTDAYDSR